MLCLNVVTYSDIHTISICCQQNAVIEPDQYKDFSLVEIISETSDTNLYRFAVRDNQRLPIAVGQHLILRLEHQFWHPFVVEWSVTTYNRCMFCRWRCEDKVVIRQYSPVASDYGCFDVVIKVTLKFTSVAKSLQIIISTVSTGYSVGLKFL